MKKRLMEKWNEALQAVLPIIAIVMVLCFSVAPVSPSILLSFLVGSALLLVGMMFFTLGADMSMSPMGERVGVCLMRSRKLALIVGVSFLLGFIITISEPDLQVLAELVPAIPNMTLILAVAVGSGLFLVIAMLRMLFGVPLPPMLVISYVVVFILAVFVPGDFLAVAFDSGGVTTGTLTVPFIMAMGVGVSAIRSDANAADDSFGLVALCSVGPILAVMLLGLVYSPESSGYTLTEALIADDSIELFLSFLAEVPGYMEEIAVSMLPIILCFLLFQLTMLKLSKRALVKISIGLVYTYVGLVLFLTGVNVGFIPAGNYLGQALVSNWPPAVLILIAAVIGYFIVKAEPAVYVLNKQVEELTDGAISAKAMGLALSVGVALAVGLAMVRVLTGMSLLWILLPGYAIGLGTSFFVPRIYTAIAFDSGGVAAGTMSTAFLLPLAQGVCTVIGRDIVADAFGIVSIVAMTPPITIQIMGLVSRFRQKSAGAAPVPLGLLEEDGIIEL